MFRNTISETPFTTDIANRVFRNINGNDYYGDVSFIATMRALLGNRIPAEESVYVVFHTTTYSLSTINSASPVALISAMSSDYINDGCDEGMIAIHSVNNSGEDAVSKNMSILDANFVGVFGNKWRKVQKVTDFFRKAFETLCFVNEEEKKVVVYVASLNNSRLHALQVGMLGLLPWYFNKESKIAEDEEALMRSLFENTSDNYMRILSDMASKYDFRTEAIKSALNGFEIRYERARANDVRREIERKTNDIMSYKEYIKDSLNKKSNLEIELLGLEAKIAQGDGSNEVMEYFLCNKHLVMDYVDGTAVRFGVKDYYVYYDEDMARSTIDNNNSFVYRPHGISNHSINKEDMKKLMTAIFLDQKLKMRVCAAYEVNARGGVSAIDRYYYSNNHEYSTYSPNTHIDRYRCMGDYEDRAVECMIRHDLISAIEQCIASCKSLNFGDSPVMNEFMARMYGESEYKVNMRCIELPDGKVVTPTEAIEWLNKEGTNE